MTNQLTIQLRNVYSVVDKQVKYGRLQHEHGTVRSVVAGWLQSRVASQSVVIKYYRIRTDNESRMAFYGILHGPGNVSETGGIVTFLCLRLAPPKLRIHRLVSLLPGMDG